MKIKFYSFALFAAVLLSFCSTTLFAKMRAYEPPAENPHPPQTKQDKARVEFAVNTMKAYFIENQADTDTSPEAIAARKNVDEWKTAYGSLKEYKHAHIVPWSWENFQKYRAAQAKPPKTQAKTSMLALSPPIIEPLPHELKADEYFVHIFVRFEQRANSSWNHLNVILTEDNKGHIHFRRFTVYPGQQALPPGVEC